MLLCEKFLRINAKISQMGHFSGCVRNYDNGVGLSVEKPVRFDIMKTLGVD